MEAFIGEISTSSGLPMPIWFIRLLGAVVLCGLIGFEREIDLRPAGVRTHILIGLAAALYTLISLHLVNSEAVASERVRTDPIRVVEAVTSGVAFLAAGLVVFSQGNVKGLKTGATMWLAAAVGVACALGMWQIATATTILSLVVIVAVRKLEQRAGTYTEDHSVQEEG